MNTDPDPGPEKGRPIRLIPVAPGVWLVILGGGVMVLGPLFGFLVGTILGTDGETLAMSPIFLCLFLGFLVAGAGLGTAILGIRRILRSRITSQPEQGDGTVKAASGPSGGGQDVDDEIGRT